MWTSNLLSKQHAIDWQAIPATGSTMLSYLLLNLLRVGYLICLTPCVLGRQDLRIRMGAKGLQERGRWIDAAGSR